MTVIIPFIIIAILLIIVYQDLKYRLIHISLLILLFSLSLTFWYLRINIISIILYNSAFLSINLIVLKAYTVLRKKKKTEDLIYGLGIGDILLFYAIIPLFSTSNYILFFITGLIFSMVLHFLISIFVTPNRLIPLAGYLSIYLIVYILYFKFVNKTFFDLLILTNYQ